MLELAFIFFWTRKYLANIIRALISDAFLLFKWLNRVIFDRKLFLFFGLIYFCNLNQPFQIEIHRFLSLNRRSNGTDRVDLIWLISLDFRTDQTFIYEWTLCLSRLFIFHIKLLTASATNVVVHEFYFGLKLFRLCNVGEDQSDCVLNLQSFVADQFLRLKYLLWHLLGDWLHYFAGEIVLLVTAFLHLHEVIPNLSDKLIVVHHFQSYLDGPIFMGLWDPLHHGEAFSTLQTIFVETINLLNADCDPSLNVFNFFKLFRDQFLLALVVALKQVKHVRAVLAEFLQKTDHILEFTLRFVDLDLVLPHKSCDLVKSPGCEVLRSLKFVLLAENTEWVKYVDILFWCWFSDWPFWRFWCNWLVLVEALIRFKRWLNAEVAAACWFWLFWAVCFTAALASFEINRTYRGFLNNFC